MRTAVVGAGFVGRAWAITFARAGHEVRLWDAEADALRKALAFIEAVLPDLDANDLLRGLSPDAVRGRISAVSDLGEALADVDYVQENTPEKVAVKRAVFANLDRQAPPGAVLASSTSAILPSAFVEAVPGRARCVVCATPSTRPISCRPWRSAPRRGHPPRRSRRLPPSCAAAGRHRW